MTSPSSYAGTDADTPVSTTEVMQTVAPTTKEATLFAKAMNGISAAALPLACLAETATLIHMADEIYARLECAPHL